MAEFIGAWRLVSVEDREPDGSLTNPYGERPVGLLLYDEAGSMSVQIMRSDRQHLSSNDWGEIPAEEIKAAAEGFTAFFGTYEVNEAEAVIIHRVEGHFLPNSVGKELKRGYEFSGSRLILRPSDSRTVTWERVE
ncbi:MAG TPA: lipocalin-like domain-containing protein [Blastocatellia bacterium]|nr:lipocalin-like domain-containing protein [Blastocatellia bacterium]